ncbi:MAG: hypothetical protein IH984_14320 [Planctomycetes bacterium]|nr:hypothetical protein [Planctomycetota bacterium]
MSTTKFKVKLNIFRFVCASLFLMLIAAGSAEAQRGGGGMRGMMGMRSFGVALEPDFNRRDIAVFNDDLSLDTSQRMIIATLFAEYDESMKAARQELTDIMQEFRPERTPEQEAARQEAREKMRSNWQSLRQQMEMARDPNLSEETRQELMDVVRKRSEEMRSEARGAFGPQIEPERLEQLAEDAADQYEIFRSEKSRLREQFVDDLQLLLNEDQKPLWPSLDRKLVRQKTLGQGQLSGESTDLFVIANELGIDIKGDADIAAIFSEYENTLDDALKARNSYTEENRALRFTAIMQRDSKQSLSLHDGEMIRRKTIRDVNETYVVSVSQVLETDLSQEFVNNYRKRAYSRLYRTTPTQRLFDQIMKFESLDPDVADAVNEIRETYEIELTVANEQMLNVIKIYEPKQRRRWLERMANFQRGSGERNWSNWRNSGDDPIREGYQARDKLDDRYYDQLASILTPDQAESLQSPRQQRQAQRRERWRGGRGDGNRERGRQNRRGGGDRGDRGGRGGFDGNDAY